MANHTSKFPSATWDGLSDNPFRKLRTDNEAPDFRDWDALVAEVIATQTVASILAEQHPNQRISILPSASTGSINFIGMPDTNSVGSGADVCVVLGGTSLYPHSIGNASLAIIPGGYGNTILNNAIMTVLIGAHHLVDTATHTAITGGSYHSSYGDYSSISGGTQNVSAGLYSVISGGRNNAVCVAVTTLSSQANIGDSTITTVLALVAGRKIHIDYGANSESFTVLSINGTTSTLDGTIAAVHASGTKVVSDDGVVSDCTVSGGVNNFTSKTQASIGGGSNNKAQGTASRVGGGTNNNASQTNATIGGGDQNVANGTYATVAGGQLNTSSGSFSCIAGGSGNLASGQYSGVPSGRGGNAYKNYIRVLASGSFAVAGDAQTWDLAMRRLTTDATATEIRSDGATEQLAMPDNTCWKFRVSIIGWRIDTHAPVADIKLEGVIYRQTGVATTSLFGSVTKTSNASNTAGTDASATADTTLGGLSIKVTGIASTSIRWSVKVEVVEVAG